MSVRMGEGGRVELHGVCGSEDAEPLLAGLIANPGATVDWRGCDSAHTAVIQVLFAAKATLMGPPAGPMLRDFVEPLLAGAGLVPAPGREA